MQKSFPRQTLQILSLSLPIFLASCHSIQPREKSEHLGPATNPNSDNTKPDVASRPTSPKPSRRTPNSAPFYVQEGVASWYGGRWIGRKTSNGEIYKSTDITAAHRSLPFNTRVRVTDLRTNRSIIVRINNRGPFIRGRIIDLSVAAAKQLGFYHRGLTKVRIEAYKPGFEPRQ